MQVITGYGYFEDRDGNIVAKAELPTGEHPLKEGYTYIEVEDKKALDIIEVYSPPIILTEEQQKEKLIAEKIRAIAITELQKEGKLDITEKIIEKE